MLSKFPFWSLLLLFNFSLASYTSAQKLYGNEWITSNQKYLKIPIVEEGFYQITRSDMETAGISVDSVPMENYQMYRRGKEIAIEVNRSASGKLDFIGFYGQKNDGALDSSLYVTPEAMPHAYYSLYSDTAAYYLSWHQPTVSPIRITDSQIPATSISQNYNLQTHHILFNSQYPAGNFYPLTSTYDNGAILTTYDVGEGWTGPEITSGNSFSINFSTENLTKVPHQPIVLELVVVGRSAGLHNITCFIETETGNQEIGKISFKDYDSQKGLFSLNSELFSLGKDQKIVIKNTAVNSSLSVSSALLQYTQKSFLPNDKNQKKFEFSSKAAIDWRLENTDGWRFYELSDPSSAKKLSAQNGSIYLESKYVFAVKEALKISNPRLIQFDNINSNLTDFLIISHPAVRNKISGVDPVEEYAKYRASKVGGGYRPLVLNIEAIYDQFNYGEPGPRGIRNAIAWLHSKAQLKFVFLIGKSIDPQTARKNKNARNIDMIPNAGWPGSDMPLTMDLEGSGQYIPLVPIGRLNASTSEPVLAYLNKVKNMEAQSSSAPWRKNILHLSGGRSSSEVKVFREYVDSFQAQMQNSALAPTISTISKKTEEDVEQFDLHENINGGAALVTMFGHSGLGITDIDIGYASDPKRNYTNDPYYPAFLVNGCALGNFYYGIPTISNDWITSKNNGAVLFISHTHNGFVSALKHYSDKFYEVLGDPNFSYQAYGSIQQETIRRVLNKYPNIYDGITCQQMSLQGDPSIKIFPAKKPDYHWSTQNIKLTNSSGNLLNAWSDSLTIEIDMFNSARYEEQNIEFSVIRSKNNVIISKHEFQTNSFPNTKHLTLTIPNVTEQGGLESWSFQIDPKALLTEETRENNNYQTTVSIPEGGATPILPLNNFSTRSNKITFVALAPENKATDQLIIEYSTDANFRTNVSSNKVTVDNFVASLEIALPEPNRYYWRVYMVGNENRTSETRVLNYDPAYPTNDASLPELIVIPNSTIKSKLLEGDTFKSEIIIKNITATPFQDSIVVSVKRRNGSVKETYFQKIGPLKGNEQRLFPISITTKGMVGTNDLEVEFNSEKLPEAVYTNNVKTMEFEVIADKIPPIIRVKVDGHYVQKYETVSPQPEFIIEITDDNPFLWVQDTTGIEIALSKVCLNCPSTTVSLKNAVWKRLKNGTFQIMFSLEEALENGTYKLEVVAKDVSGNQAPPYEIQLIVINEPLISKLSVSPNPSTEWFKFSIQFQGNTPPPSWSITIFNQSGMEVTKYTTKPHIGINEWIWNPKSSASGIYLYHMEIEEQDHQWSDSSFQLKKGKIVLIK